MIHILCDELFSHFKGGYPIPLFLPNSLWVNGLLPSSVRRIQPRSLASCRLLLRSRPERSRAAQPAASHSNPDSPQADKFLACVRKPAHAGVFSGAAVLARTGIKWARRAIRVSCIREDGSAWLGAFSGDYALSGSRYAIHAVQLARTGCHTCCKACTSSSMWASVWNGFGVRRSRSVP